MTHRSIAVPLVAVMIPFDKVQLIFICGVHSKLSSKFSVCASSLRVENPFHIRERLWHICYFTFKFDFKMAHLPSSCLLVAEVNAPLKNASSVFLDIIITAEMIVKKSKKKKFIILFIV
jgi:hypothetical protein